MERRFWKVWIDTRNFAFEAYAETLDEAFLALRRTWEAHRKQTGADMTWTEDIYPNVSFVQFDLGQGYRDGEALGAAGRRIS